MPKSKTWVVKLGGAMMLAPELPMWLEACFCGEGDVACVVVVGGGAFADHVRGLHARWAFDETVAHDLALDAMRMNARALGPLAPGARTCSGMRSIAGGLERGADLLWHPPRPFRVTALPKTWDATSDSIALWLGQELSADAVILVKSVDAAALADASAAALSEAEIVDRHFPVVFSRRPVRVRVVARSAFAAFRQGRVNAQANLFGYAVR